MIQLPQFKPASKQHFFRITVTFNKESPTFSGLDLTYYKITVILTYCVRFYAYIW